MPDPERWVKLVVKLPLAAFETPVAHEAWRDIPVTYVMCEDDNTVPPFLQRMLVDRLREAGVALEVESWQSNHSPMLIMPEKVVDLIVKAASSSE